MAARCRLGILQSWLAVLQSCLSILQSRPVSPQSSPRRSSVLTLYFDQLRAPFTESTPPAAAKSHAPFTGSVPLLPPKPQSPIAGLLRCRRRSLTYLLRDLPRRGGLLVVKTKKRGHPTSDALALFSNDVAPTLALTPYSRTQVPSGDRIPRLYA